MRGSDGCFVFLPPHPIPSTRSSVATITLPPTTPTHPPTHPPPPPPSGRAKVRSIIIITVVHYVFSSSFADPPRRDVRRQFCSPSVPRRPSHTRSSATAVWVRSLFDACTVLTFTDGDVSSSSDWRRARFRRPCERAQRRANAR